MDEDIWLAVIRRYETESFDDVEPFAVTTATC